MGDPYRSVPVATRAGNDAAWPDATAVGRRALQTVAFVLVNHRANAGTPGRRRSPARPRGKEAASMRRARNWHNGCDTLRFECR